MNKLLFNELDDWTFPLIEKTYSVIEKIALNDYKLDVYPNQIEIIDSEQMLEAYTSVGMPTYYNHWSFGKSFESQHKSYTGGYSNLAYEIVINCLSENSIVFHSEKGFIPLKDTNINDKIYDGFNFVQISNITKSIKTTKKISLSDGSEIIATNEHVFPVISNDIKTEKSVQNLNVNDYFLVYNSNYPLLKSLDYSLEIKYPNNSNSDFVPNYLIEKYNTQKINRTDFLNKVNLDNEDIWFKNFKVVKIKEITENSLDNVIDITVNSNSHLFLANNILTHNCNPCIAYLQENNTMTMQSLVIAHASFGHNAVFKGNEYFKTWTNASSIMDYLVFAKKYIEDCEKKYSSDEVELFLDSCHALQYHGVNTYKPKTKKKNETQNIIINPAFDKILDFQTQDVIVEDKMIRPTKNSNNILYFIEKNAPNLPEWKREIIRIVRTIAQYFYPQMITKVVNEGYATYTHYNIMHKLYDDGYISIGSLMEFLNSHSSVIAQSGVDIPGSQFRGWNPYALGFSIFRDIERICKNPTQEDKEFLPHLIGKNYLEATSEAMKNFNDSNFIYQYLSPKVMRDFKMFTLLDNKKSSKYEVSNISNEDGYYSIKGILSNQHERDYSIPNIEVVGSKISEDRKLILKYNPYNNRELNYINKSKILKHLQNLWGFEVIIE